MSFSERYKDLSLAINNSPIVSAGQKKILNILVEFEKGIPMSRLSDLTGASKQALYFNIKRLLERELIVRERKIVYIYKVNEPKIVEILDSYIENKKYLKIKE